MSPQVDFDVVVIGGGIVGLGSAYKISQNNPGVSIGVVEKEDRLAAHQTGHNSCVIHSGLYYRPGSVKARTCKEGREELVVFAKKHKLPYEVCGKIIVATKRKEQKNLDKIFQNGIDNGIEGIERIDSEQIEEIEPFCRGVAGVKVPCTGIIDFSAVAEKLGELIEGQSADNKILLSNEVVGLDKHDFFTNVITTEGSFKTRYIVNCAGLYSDKVAKMDNIRTDIRIVPFRGDYYKLSEEAAQKVKHLIYPVADLDLPFLGVHFSRKVDDTVECGPNAVFSFKREGYRKTDFSFRDSWDSLSFPGTWKLFLRHSIYGLGEYSRAFSKKLLLVKLKRLIPSLELDDISRGSSGVRAQAVDSAGRLIDDFQIIKRGNAIHILNAPSPAATASLAIGSYVNEVASDYFGLKGL